ncbi:VOC family protein [Leifsonia sp. NPDC058248]|uniref:VOC family protein n=1 Tax=Leifsonia sp. NPDC058248 TaxID=3346402 RepID=UPI0036D7C7F4
MTDTRESADAGQSTSGAVPLRFEVVVLPVADVDRAKAFYEGLRWRLDADFPIDEHFRIVQFTPPGSPTSIQFGLGTSTAEPGSSQGLYLIVDDVEAARADLISHGANVSEIWHGRGLGSEGHKPGVDPKRASYGSFASFTDPDGNSWLLQEVTNRLPGRVALTDVQGLADLLLETSLRHGSFESVAPAHNWWDWYAAYFDARQNGATPDAASAEANRYMAEVKRVVVPAS